MEIKASAKYLRISPRKLRLLARGLRGLPPQKALEKLEFYPQRGRELLIKLIKQAVANATANFRQEESDLKIKGVQIGEGPVSKRMDKSHGARFDRGMIRKKTAHLYLTLETKEPSGSQTNQKKEVKVIKSDNKTVAGGGKSSFSASRRIRRTSGAKS